MEHDYFPVPSPDDAPQEKLSFGLWLANLAPKQVLQSLYQALIQAGGQLCAFSPDQLGGMLARLVDTDALELALKACPCQACAMKADYVKEAGPVLIKAMQRIAEIHCGYQARAEEIRHGKERRDRAKATVGNALTALRQAGKLGMS